MSLLIKLIEDENLRLTKRDFLSRIPVFLFLSEYASSTPIQYVSSSIEQKLNPTKFQSLDFLRDLAQARSYSYEQFFDEIRQRLESEDISAFIFGETHYVHSQMDLAFETLKIIRSSSRRIVRFLDEMVSWDKKTSYKNDRGGFAEDYGDSKGILTRANGSITHILKNILYTVFHPLKLQEISDLVRRLGENEIIVTYTGNPHADSVFKDYILSLDMPNELAGIPTKQYPTVSDEIKKSGRRRISLMMYQLNNLKEYSKKGFEREVTKEFKGDKKRKNYFQLQQKRLLAMVHPNKIYRIRPDVYILITNEPRSEKNEEVINIPMPQSP